jgi:small subunit ribosomal protein S1
MSTDTQRGESVSPQPQLDEGYWESLLTEGEFAQSEQGTEIDTEDISSKYYINPYPPSEDESRLNDQEDDWSKIAELMDNDQVLQLKVVGYNRGGLLVEWQSLRGFVPASQLVHFPSSEEDTIRRDALIEHVGATLQLRVIELDAEKNRFILSERAAQVAAGTRDEVLTNLHTGDITRGLITNLCEFGAFIDLGGVEGLIHISELSWGRVGHPADMLERGQEIDVYVLDVDPKHGRIALSFKRLHPDPWATVHERYQIGEVVEGEITNVVDFGAFACIEEGLEGLIHFSELAEGHFLHPRNVVKEGEVVKARILSIDGRARRLGLSLRLL